MFTSAIPKACVILLSLLQSAKGRDRSENILDRANCKTPNAVIPATLLGGKAKLREL